MKGMQPIQGLLTFDAEGHEGGRFHSRILHVPSPMSGITIGRGYDCRFKPPGKVETDLIFAGVDKANAKRIAKGAGLAGDAAKRFIEINQLDQFELTHQQQLKLFERVYREELLETKRV